jgi:integration host factor subunit beta
MAAHFWGIPSCLSYFAVRNSPMNKSDLITTLSRKEKLKEKDATDIINLIFDGFAQALKNGGRVEIRGFGNFSVRQYANRKNSKHRINITPNRLPFFKAGKEIKEKVNGGRP